MTRRRNRRGFLVGFQSSVPHPRTTIGYLSTHVFSVSVLAKRSAKMSSMVSCACFGLDALEVVIVVSWTTVDSFGVLMNHRMESDRNLYTIHQRRERAGGWPNVPVALAWQLYVFFCHSCSCSCPSRLLTSIRFNFSLLPFTFTAR